MVATAFCQARSSFLGADVGAYRVVRKNFNQQQRIVLLADRLCCSGATGYIGLPVALELAEAGLHTSALLRSNASKSNKREAALKKLKEANVSTFEASLDEEESLIDILKGFDTVVSTLSGSQLCSLPHTSHK